MLNIQNGIPGNTNTDGIDSRVPPNKIKQRSSFKGEGEKTEENELTEIEGGKAVSRKDLSTRVTQAR